MRRLRWAAFAAAAIACGLFPSIADADEHRPVAVSPGSGSGTAVASSCPTFSWAGVQGAESYELIVFRATESAIERDAPVLRKSVPGGATSWTPGLDGCLGRGGRYAWTVRAEYGSSASPWAPAQLFTISAGPTRAEVKGALDVVRRYLASGGSLSGLETAGTGASPPEGSVPAVGGPHSQGKSATGTPTYELAAESSSNIDASAAVFGQATATSGRVSGLLGTTASPDGAGLVAENVNGSGGADILLDGSAQGLTDAYFSESGVDRPSNGAETFNFHNSGGGTMTLQINGVDLVNLGSLACASGEVAQWNNSSWVCATAGSGDITSVTPGTGLSGGGTSGDLTLSVDTSKVQTRVGSTCATGSSISAIGENGTVTCYADANTTYTAGLGLKLAGSEFSAQGTPIAQVVVAAKGGGNFTSVQAAIDSITDAAATKPYLVYVAPGIYTEQVALKPYVTLQGAGQGVTILHWTGGDSPGASSATLTGADNATVRDLTVESDSTSSFYAYAIYNSSSSPRVEKVGAVASGGTITYAIFNAYSSPTMENVTVAASGGSSSNYGIHNYSASPKMESVIVTASGGSFTYGVENNQSSSPTMENVTVDTSDGRDRYGVISDSSSSPTIRNSVITGATLSVAGGGYVADSQLIGSVGTGLTCFGNYDENLAGVACP